LVFLFLFYFSFTRPEDTVDVVAIASHYTGCDEGALPAEGSAPNRFHVHAQRPVAQRCPRFHRRVIVQNVIKYGFNFLFVYFHSSNIDLDPSGFMGKCGRIIILLSAVLNPSPRVIVIIIPYTLVITIYVNSVVTCSSVQGNTSYLLFRKMLIQIASNVIIILYIIQTI